MFRHISLSEPPSVGTEPCGIFWNWWIKAALQPTVVSPLMVAAEAIRLLQKEPNQRGRTERAMPNGNSNHRLEYQLATGQHLNDLKLIPYADSTVRYSK